MQAKKRYLLLISCCAFLSIGYFGYYHWKRDHEDTWFHINLSCYLESNDIVIDEDISTNPRAKTKLEYGSSANEDDDIPFRNCRMETCFDFTLCDNDFKVYVYPIDDNVPPSASYLKVIKAIQGSNYFTSDPSQACVFVLSLDTLDRDSLSKDYIRNMPPRVQKLPLWNSGQNHIIFNLYSGSWPEYSEDLGFDVGKAILAKASISVLNFRPNFDISLPLFHKSHPDKGGEFGHLKSNHFPSIKKYLLGFKGKRYVYGIGSETRNSLYHLHNNADIILVTTCKHGGSWKEYKDDRCDHDNSEYDRFDYEELLNNATFCLVPRGRRLGSFRFLEVLQAGCIPVLLANGWELPFAEVIDWKKAAVWADERLLLQVPDMIRSVLPSEILEKRQQTQILWNQYFSSVERIILSTLEIVRERVHRFRSRPAYVWNSVPGALSVHLSFSDYLPSFPFYYSITGTEPSARYTAVVLVSFGWSGSIHTSPLYKLIKNITKSKFVEKILVLWSSKRQGAPVPSRLPGGDVPVAVVATNQSILARYQVYQTITTDAVFTLDEDALLTAEELDFAFTVWTTFPDRIVGFSGRMTYWNEAKKSWTYTSRWLNSYSMILTGAAIYHRYYLYVLTALPPSLLSALSSSSSQCDDILLNMLVSDIIWRPPIKLSQRKQYKDFTPETRRQWNDANRLHQRSICVNAFINLLGHLSLFTSNLRLDPVLFKDKVSVQRKKYRQIEKITT